MASRLGEHLPEILIIGAGLIMGLVEVFLVRDNNLAALIVIVSFLLSITTYALRKEIQEQIAQQLEIPRIIEAIPSQDWRRDAQTESKRLSVKLQE